MVWTLFISMIIIFIAIDLGVFNRSPHAITVKEATIWTAVWVSFALTFSAVIYFVYVNQYVENPTGLSPSEAVLKYLTGYLIELSLSVDNIFVIAVIFGSFNIPPKYQHRVLFWGILGAIVFRAIMILFGVTLVNQFTWMIYVFGLFLLYTAYRMYTSPEFEFDPKESLVFRGVRKYIPITKELSGESFFVKIKHVRAATPLFVALMVIEVSDVLFAIDSIPAVLAITSDPFLVFTSNILAILGLRSMYFFLANMLAKFVFLEYSLIFILSFVGVKMLLADIIHLPEWFSLGTIAIALFSGIIYSIYNEE